MCRFHDLIHNERGVSMVYALMFLLIAFSVSAIMLGASLTALERVNGDSSREQDRLIVSSAAKLMREDLGKTSCEVVTREGEDLYEVRVSAIGSSLISKSVENTMKDLTSEVGGRSESAGGQFEIKVDPDRPTGVSDSIDTAVVDVEYTISRKQGDSLGPDDSMSAYDIDATLSLKGSDQQMFLKAPSTSNDSDTSVEAGITTRTYKVTWSESGVKLSTQRHDEDV